MNNREIDKLIAMYIIERPWKLPGHGYCCTCQTCGYSYDSCQCGYSSDIGKCWDIVEIVKTEYAPFVLSYDGGMWSASFGHCPIEKSVDAPISICLAALKARKIL